MAYFSNGTEGMDFDERWCSRCVNMPERDDRGCAVWGAHLRFAYEECNGTGNAKKILDMLIEETDEGPRCAMFVDKNRKPIRHPEDIERDKELAKRRPKLIDWPKEPRS